MCNESNIIMYRPELMVKVMRYYARYDKPPKENNIYKENKKAKKESEKNIFKIFIKF